MVYKLTVYQEKIPEKNTYYGEQFEAVSGYITSAD